MAILYDELTTGLLAAEIAPFLAVRNDAAIAEIISQNRMRLTEKLIGSGSIVETIGIAAGNALLDAIYGNADFRYIKPLIEQGRLDVSSILVRAALDSLVPLVITQSQADAIKALAEVADPVSVNDVSAALNGGI